MAVSILKVSQLNRYVRSQLESDRRLSELYVAGEIGSMTVNQRSGHLYFTLKDPNASVRAVMFASHAEHLRFLPKPGLAVIARGAATLYERDGAFQMIVSELMLDGAGALGLAFEQLKEKLAAQGLFSEDRKRPIPPNPRIIGIVTSPSGAALHDIVSVAQRRNPSVLLLLAPAAVQGREASASIAEANPPAQSGWPQRGHPRRQGRRLCRGSLGLQRRGGGSRCGVLRDSRHLSGRPRDRRFAL